MSNHRSSDRDDYYSRRPVGGLSSQAPPGELSASRTLSKISHVDYRQSAQIARQQANPEEASRALADVTTGLLGALDDAVDDHAPSRQANVLASQAELRGFLADFKIRSERAKLAYANRIDQLDAIPQPILKEMAMATRVDTLARTKDLGRGMPPEPWVATMSPADASRVLRAEWRRLRRKWRKEKDAAIKADGK